jgi:hypothetical protein
MITSGNSYKHLHPRLTGRAGQTVVFSTVCLGFNLCVMDSIYDQFDCSFSNNDSPFPVRT